MVDVSIKPYNKNCTKIIEGKKNGKSMLWLKINDM